VDIQGILFFPISGYHLESYSTDLTNFVTALDIYQAPADASTEEQFPATPGFGTYSEIKEAYKEFSGQTGIDKTAMLMFMAAYMFAYGVNTSQSLDPVKPHFYFFI